MPKEIIPDLNDPAVTLSRAAGMDAMRARRRETALAEVEDDDRQALLDSRAAEPAQASPAGTLAPGAADDDKDDGDAIAAAERTRLEAEAAKDVPAAPAVDQLERQRVEDTTLAPSHTVKLKVNGVERDVPLTEVIARAQQVEAADAYLESAKERAKKIIADAEAHAASAPKSQDAPAAPPSNTSKAEKLKAYHEALFQGDETRASELLAEAMAQDTTAPNAELVQQITGQVVWQSAFDSARERFEKDHADIVGNEHLRLLANSFIASELKSHGVTTLQELSPKLVQTVFDNAGRATRAVLGGDAPRSTPAVALDATRRNAKQQIDEPASASGRTTSSVTPPATTHDTLNKMRAARGQPVFQ